MPCPIRSEPDKGMEKRLSLKTTILALFAALIGAFLLAQNAAAQEVSFQRKIRLPLWAELDAYPGLIESGSPESGKFDWNQGIFDYAIRQVKKITPFLINGMVYGWEFDYTPSDRLRGVAEYFEVKEIRPFDEEAKKIYYEKPWFDFSKVHCWANFERDDAMVQSYDQWSDVRNPRIMGVGGGKIQKGF